MEVKVLDINGKDTGRKVQRGRTMKILIVSDTHAKHGNLDYVLEQAGSIDLFIHLGDVEGDEEYLDAVIEVDHGITIFAKI